MPVAVRRSNNTPTEQRVHTFTVSINRRLRRIEADNGENSESGDISSSSEGTTDADLEPENLYDGDYNDGSAAEEDNIIMVNAEEDCNAPFNENFYYSFCDRIGNGSCGHAVNLMRPCRYCKPKISRPAFEAVADIFRKIFPVSRMKRPDNFYQPLDTGLTRNHFKAITAMHSLEYHRKLLREVQHWIVSAMNQPLKGFFASQIPMDLLWLHGRVTEAVKAIKELDPGSEEYHLFMTFKRELNALGAISSNKENWHSSEMTTLIECHR